MIRARFTVTGVDDHRPISWPVRHPFWCTGYDGNDNPIVIAYAEDEEEIRSLWPEATGIEATVVEGYSFSDRFPRPSWCTEGG